MVGSAILLSRLAGLVRQRVFGHYLGMSAAADAFTIAFRIPNALQNLFGEGALSASFIPVYAGLLARDDAAGARRLASAVFALLAMLVSLMVLAGLLATPLLVRLLAPGFAADPAQHQLVERLVRVLFPGAGILVLSAWCLGVLNSHQRFFLPYAAPLAWNAAIIGALAWQGGAGAPEQLVLWAAWGSVAGSVAQFAVQLPGAWRAAGAFLTVPALEGPVRTVLANFVPALVSRGVVQVSAYVDTVLASLLPTGAAAALGYSQVLYLLPVSLFGMSISAAELPAMAREAGREALDGEAVRAALRDRLSTGLRRIAFFVVPSAVAFAMLGEVVAAALFQSGRFGAGDSRYVWAILAGAAPGLLATTQARLYSSTFFAVADTRTPLRFALVRVALSAALGWGAAFVLPGVLGIEARWGVAGLTLAASVAGWAEYLLLRRALRDRIGPIAHDVGLVLRLVAAALLAGAGARGVWLVVRPGGPWVVAAAVLGTYGLLYVGTTVAFGVTEARGLLGRVARRRA